MSRRIDAAEAKKIRARVDAASPGPWKAEIDQYDEEEGLVACVDGPDLVPFGRILPDEKHGGIDQAMNDARFAAHAREDVPDLLDEVERLRSLVRRLIVTWANSEADYTPEQQAVIEGAYRTLYPNGRENDVEGILEDWSRES